MAQGQIQITGRIIDSANNHPLQGATIKIMSTQSSSISDENGYFKINAIQNQGILIITFVGYKTAEIPFSKTNTDTFEIHLAEDYSTLKEVSVVSTGYQKIPKERATGSFVQVDNALINRSVSTNILDRLNGVTSGLFFQSNGEIQIRGRATLFSNPNPLIVIDNFPYNGDLSNINPNDVENITVLKDGAAASAWGSRSGNGVIVITTKKGHLNTAPIVSVTANTTIGEKPDLYYTPQLTSAEYIGVEQYLFNNGAYDNIISNGYQAISPAVSIFLAKRNGSISALDSASEINKLKTYDIRQQLSKYIYRPSVSQQYQANINGGGATQTYFVSAGYDKNLSNTRGNNYDRVTLNASNTYYFLKKKLEVYSNIVYTGSSSTSSPVQTQYQNPYDQIADANGNALPIANNLNIPFATTAGNGKFLDWLYRPLDELNNNYGATKSEQNDLRLNLSVDYKILDGFSAKALYSYEKSVNEGNTLHELQSYYTRNLINSYAQIDPNTSAMTYPIPIGAILNTSQTDIKSNNGRFQLNYQKGWNRHEVNAIAGAEIDDFESLSSNNMLYGYNPANESNQSALINYTTYFPQSYGFDTKQIPYNNFRTSASNRFVSEYFNGSYTYDSKYIASISGRRDESNLFGVAENQKGIPLWSAGLAWIINKENFYKIDWLPELKLRGSYGYTGNVNTSVSAYLTAMYQQGLVQTYNAYFTSISNPPNPSLRWEKDQNINIGIDFGSKGNRLYGSIEYWVKNGQDLIGNSPIAPQTGITLYTGNTANTSTKGVDLQLNSINLDGKLKWFTTLLYNYNHSIVTDYKVSNGTNLNVVQFNYNNPLKGYPYYAIFSFKYAGLDSKGNPQGYLNNQITEDYTAIENSSNRNELVYSGSSVPTSFGSLRNTFSYNNFDFSFNLTFRLGYYFRRSSLNNSILYGTGGYSYQMADFENRWQTPGDEQRTNVPSLIYPADGPRDYLYSYSNVLIEKADNVRLQDLRLGYTINRSSHFPISRINFFIYCNNVGILWKATKYHLDPDYTNGNLPLPKTIAFGVKAEL